METVRNYSEREIIESIRSGQNFNEVIRHLYQVNYRKVVAYIMQNNGNEEDAQDNFQEVMITFVEVVKQEKFRGESSVSTFLLALTRNIWLNELKKRGRSQLRDEKFEKSRSRVDEDISKFLTHRELRTEVMDLLGTIGNTCKKILLAFYYENLSMKEILQQLDYENEQVVRNKKYKCLKQLEQMLSAKPTLANNLKEILSYE
jgi:RNA polymerase sigma factor (sigma-70 family)